jgi:protein-disulfide isomerase
MFTVLDEWCTWCLVTHILNLLIALCIVLMYPRGGAATKQQTKRPAVESAVPAITPAAHPSTRLVVITLIAIGIVGYAHLSRTGLTNWKTQATAFRNIYKADTDKLVRNWELAETHAILIREDDAIRTYGKAGKPTWDLVVFSDFECPSCKKTAKFLEEEAQRLFAGHLRFIFRHYPLNSDCNARTDTKVHKYACTGVAIVEAARLLGGGQAFWDAHDFLFANQDLLKKGRLTPEAVAIQLGFDPPMFESMMKSKVTAKRVWQDVNAAKTYGVMGTPTVFVEGKRVDNLALQEIAFWDRLADRYWAMAKTPRPDSAKLRPVQPTPSSRDRTDDP